MPDIDNDGVYELQLRDTWQTTHPIDFLVKDRRSVVEYADIDFKSNLYWSLDDTIGYFEHQDLTDDMEYNTYGTSYVIGGNLHDLVPTTNYSEFDKFRWYNKKYDNPFNQWRRYFDFSI